MAAKSRSQVNQGAGKQIGDNQLAAKIVRHFFGSANHQSIIYKILGRNLAASARWSISTPSALEAPSLSAATAKIPEPQPQSSTVVSVSFSVANRSRQRAVLGCFPVPNARAPSVSSVSQIRVADSRSVTAVILSQFDTAARARSVDVVALEVMNILGPLV